VQGGGRENGAKEQKKKAAPNVTHRWSHYFSTCDMSLCSPQNKLSKKNLQPKLQSFFAFSEILLTNVVAEMSERASFPCESLHNSLLIKKSLIAAIVSFFIFSLASFSCIS
jgi:hypothetical protein